MLNSAWATHEWKAHTEPRIQGVTPKQTLLKCQRLWNRPRKEFSNDWGHQKITKMSVWFPTGFFEEYIQADISIWWNPVSSYWSVIYCWRQLSQMTQGKVTPGGKIDTSDPKVWKGTMRKRRCTHFPPRHLQYVSIDGEGVELKSGLKV